MYKLFVKIKIKLTWAQLKYIMRCIVDNLIKSGLPHILTLRILWHLYIYLGIYTIIPVQSNFYWLIVQNEKLS